jgi:hypothetical protein
MHFHANYVSTSVFGDGDYYHATFEAEQDTDDPDSPYLLIQRQFEDPDHHRLAARSSLPDARCQIKMFGSGQVLRSCNCKGASA